MVDGRFSLQKTLELSFVDVLKHEAQGRLSDVEVLVIQVFGARDADLRKILVHSFDCLRFFNQHLVAYHLSDSEHHVVPDAANF